MGCLRESILPGAKSGVLSAPPSKSHAQRLLICAALSDRPVRLFRCGESEDVLAAVRCLRALGAKLCGDGACFSVSPIRFGCVREAVLDVGESGAVLRFLLPLIGVLGVRARLRLQGALSSRPIEPLCRVLRERGMRIERDGSCLLCSGSLCAGEFSLAGDISSQFISALLLALPLLPEKSRIRLTSPLQSADYVCMTLDVLRQAGADVSAVNGGWEVSPVGRYRLPDSTVEGDWSSSAVFLALGAFSANGVRLTGLNARSLQPDRSVLNHLRAYGARVFEDADSVTVCSGRRLPLCVDVSPFPDLFPLLAVLGAAAEGDTLLKNAARVRLKESDRLNASAALLHRFGVDTEQADGELLIHGRGRLRGGIAPACPDHRMAMAAALAAAVSENPVIIEDAQCVGKSCPEFFALLHSLKGESL